MLFGLPAKARTDHIPWATYTDPELAQVGLTEAQAREQHGEKLFVAKAEFTTTTAPSRLDRPGVRQGHGGEGQARRRHNRRPQAGELIQIWALAIANGLKMSAVAGMVAPYPTLGEINKRAAGAYFSPKLFDSPMVKRVVGLVQRLVP
jgi:pyruvate/2-oxoglutarate dehydrogenase complex dihydrolipoamide dehydrogenase (E3) component